MLEREMQDLLAKYPEELIEPGLKLLDKEGYVGEAYYDLLFETRHGHRLLVEIKSVPLNGKKGRETLEQVLEYYQKLKMINHNPPVFMMVIAPDFSFSTQQAFEEADISAKRITRMDYERIAKIHDYHLHAESNADKSKVDNKEVFGLKTAGNPGVKFIAHRIADNSNKMIEVRHVVSRQEVIEYVKFALKRELSEEELDDDVIKQFSARKAEWLPKRVPPKHITDPAVHLIEFHKAHIAGSKNPEKRNYHDNECIKQCFRKERFIIG